MREAITYAGPKWARWTICSRNFHQLIGTQEDKCYGPFAIAGSKAFVQSSIISDARYALRSMLLVKHLG